MSALFETSQMSVNELQTFETYYTSSLLVCRALRMQYVVVVSMLAQHMNVELCDDDSMYSYNCQQAHLLVSYTSCVGLFIAATTTVALL